MKKPLITYPEWIAIDGQVRGLPIEEQGGAVSRWKLWEDRPTEEKRKWLKELGRYPKQRPVRRSTANQGLRHLGQEESLPGTEIYDGETERDVDLVDREKEPKLAESEWVGWERVKDRVQKQNVGWRPTR